MYLYRLQKNGITKKSSCLLCDGILTLIAHVCGEHF
jgi:hypothetical protein